MKLPSFRRLFNQDYPKEFQKLIDTLSVSLNNGIEVLYNALNNQLTIRDNLKATVRDVLVTVNATGIPIQGGTFTLDFDGNVDGVIVISAINQVNSSIYPTSGVFISGVQSNKSFIINNITGLQAGQSYSLRVVAFGR